STSGMTESFYGFWFLLAALCLVRARRDNLWLLAAAAALLPPSLTRFDGWILLPALVPLAWWQRRAGLLVGAGALAILALAPGSWLALNYAVTGNPISFLSTHG